MFTANVLAIHRVTLNWGRSSNSSSFLSLVMSFGIFDEVVALVILGSSSMLFIIYPFAVILYKFLENVEFLKSNFSRGKFLKYEFVADYLAIHRLTLNWGQFLNTVHSLELPISISHGVSYLIKLSWRYFNKDIQELIARENTAKKTK